MQNREKKKTCPDAAEGCVYGHVILIDEGERHRLRGLRMEKVFEEPGSKDRHGSLRQASLGSPWVALHHTHLLEGLLLP